eukprot:gene11455-23959_t
MESLQRNSLSNQLLHSQSKDNVLKCLLDFNIVQNVIITADPINSLIKVRIESFNEDFINHLGLLERFHQHVVDCIAQYDDSIQNYLSPYTAICQASGMGKSRLIKEYSISYPIEYFSFSTGNSYPSRNPFVIDHLMGHIHSSCKIEHIFETFIISAVLKVLFSINGHEGPKLTCQQVFDSQVPLPGAKPEGNDKELVFWKWEDLNVENKFSPKDVEAIIVFDEARFLVEQIDNVSSVSLFRLFRRALASADRKLSEIGLRVFGIVMDTASSVANFTPANDSSARADCLVDKSWPLTLVDAFSARRMASYERPFIAKFLHSDHDLRGKTELTEYQQIAVLCSRLTIHITNSSQLADSLSSKHLGVITRVSDNRKLIYTVSPSEPVLSEAAYKIITTHPNQKTFIKCLHRQLFMGGVAPGFCGEMISQYLLILARDKAIADSAPFSTCKVVDFLRVINSQCIPNYGKNNKSSLILDGTISFNHFTELKYTPSVYDLTKCFLRMTAVQCKTGLSGIDLIIPVLLPRGKYKKETVSHQSPCTAGTKGHNDNVFNSKVFVESESDVQLHLKKLSTANKGILDNWNSFQRPCEIPENSEITPDRMSFILIQVRNKPNDAKSRDGDIIHSTPVLFEIKYLKLLILL